jgi:hypothetical protein
MEKFKFEQMIRMLELFADNSQCYYMYPTMFKFQFQHMVARLVNMACLEKKDIKPCPEFPFALLCLLYWSKNAREEEQDAPYQILLGAIDPNYCILLAFAIFLKLWIGSGEGILSHYIFGKAGNDTEMTKNCTYESLKTNVLDNNKFWCVVLRGPLGTHSNQEFGSTWAWRNGCVRDDVDCLGRWKRRREQVDDCINVTSKLCIGGPCKYYVLKEGSCHMLEKGS